MLLAGSQAEHKDVILRSPGAQTIGLGVQQVCAVQKVSLNVDNRWHYHISLRINNEDLPVYQLVGGIHK